MFRGLLGELLRLVIPTELSGLPLTRPTNDILTLTLTAPPSTIETTVCLSWNSSHIPIQIGDERKNPTAKFDIVIFFPQKCVSTTIRRQWINMLVSTLTFCPDLAIVL